MYYCPWPPAIVHQPVHSTWGSSFDYSTKRHEIIVHYFPWAMVKKNITWAAEEVGTVPGFKVWFNKINITFLRG